MNKIETEFIIKEIELSQSRKDWESGKEPDKHYLILCNIFPVSPFDDSTKRIIFTVDGEFFGATLEAYDMGKESVIVRASNLYYLKKKPKNINVYKF